MRSIEFEVSRFDKDAVEYQVVCSNGLFTGTAKMYLSHDGLQGAANTRSGFPCSTTDLREVRLVRLNPNWLGEEFACPSIV